MAKVKHEFIHELSSFTPRMAKLRQVVEAGKTMTDAEFPYPYISKKEYASLGNPLFVKITIEPYNPDEEADDVS